MKSKGFTLIELLAVIVILAVIALIATPMILGVIETARKGTAESSAYGYIEALESYQVMQQVTNPNAGLFNSNKTVSELNGLVEIKGKKPTEGYVTFDKGKVTNYQLQFGEYLVKYNAETKKAEATKEEFGGLGTVVYEYNIGDQVTIDGVSYYVIKNSYEADETLTLIRYESIGDMKFDENDGTDFETSTLKTYLNSTYKETFGEKASMIVGDITLLDFGTWTPEIEEGYMSAVDDISGEEGTYAYLYKNGYESVLRGAETAYSYDIWTKTAAWNSGEVIVGVYHNEEDGKYHIKTAEYSTTDGYQICSAQGCMSGNITGIDVRPVITIKKEAITN